VERLDGRDRVQNRVLERASWPCEREVVARRPAQDSAPLKELQRKFGFEPERVTEIAKELLGKGKKS
jgi:hypothetical protein